MPSICYICLRGNLNLRSTSEELEHLYKELCEFNNENDCKFCYECINKLRKFYDFKQSCLVAAKKLKSWKKHKSNLKEPIQLPYNEMPLSQLSFCKRNNFKIYFCNADTGISAPMTVSGPKNSHIITMNILRDNFVNVQFDSKAEIIDNFINVEHIKQESVSIIEEKDLGTLFNDSDRNGNVKPQVKAECDSSKNNSHKEINEYTNYNMSEQDGSDSDDSINEHTPLKDLLSKLKKENTEKVDKFSKTSSIDTDTNTKVRKKKSIDKDVLKNLLKKKFKKFGPVKDDKGTIIDIDIVINNLDSFTVKFLRTINKFCLRSGPFQQNDVRVLSRIQARFPYTSVFKIKCLQDDMEQMMAEFEKRQNYPDYVKSNHRCESCLKAFKCGKILEYHNKIQHDESMPVECTLCHTRHKNKLMLYKHTQSAHAMVYECKLCNFITNYKESMLKHYEKHEGSTGFNCKYCGENFSFNAQLYLHINKVHGARNICELCACAFHSVNGLKQHKIRKHERNGEDLSNTELSSKCDECNVSFISDAVYRNHLKISHKIKEPKELKTDRKQRKYACHLCDWEGCGLASRKEHYASAHPTEGYNSIKLIQNVKKHLCETCGKEFTNITVYKGHLNTHTGVRPYACNVCGKTFFSTQCLQLHKERHLPPSRECNICGKKYNNLTNLLRHKKIHNPQKYYSCTMCEKVFSQNYLLKQHIKGVHFDGYKKRKEFNN